MLFILPALAILGAAYADETTCDTTVVTTSTVSFTTTITLESAPASTIITTAPPAPPAYPTTSQPSAGGTAPVQSVADCSLATVTTSASGAETASAYVHCTCGSQVVGVQTTTGADGIVTSTCAAPPYPVVGTSSPGAATADPVGTSTTSATGPDNTSAGTTTQSTASSSEPTSSGSATESSPEQQTGSDAGKMAVNGVAAMGVMGLALLFGY
ncbi:hypothetical protein AC579_1424 [Pseudocercospora musae]|uniref:Uncharacterized protein n=1 Tax=Pseudocercospora musae TaxID=113226 RepID=A0A139IN06_9PEZI|nr:hypothetical protein AC579_1424 [Pseudocercospora musae]